MKRLKKLRAKIFEKVFKMDNWSDILKNEENIAQIVTALRKIAQKNMDKVHLAISILGHASDLEELAEKHDL